ncbi:arabinofuranan 3-O-arabinosyltransferase [Jatrophihabitans endophyticus]|uniref:Arabinofuranan 3-O-arabinosyltransferase n=1 Tax=Jatrophihabitans endophyticus TaxID=1206085 RepID=A0A1M5CWS9_9ACTN|nr:arabinofuranan 3-O-arabinosyltransferase [Jatrophihabitans endophyticus]
MPAAAAVVERLRLVAACLAITLAVFSQDAGSVAADTKMDLVVDPARFLHRALALWDPVGSAGQLQDQAYGYLFPMGPFFLLTHTLGLPAWVAQRCWETLIVLAAFLGAYRVARRLAITSSWGRLAAAATYTLAPRTLSELFSISAELLPVAAAPWVLLPLIDGARGGSPRRAAALSGVALLFAGGINASATLAVLPVPALWLLTRARGPRRAALLRWWALAVVLACAWWALPLVVLGRYSPPFLDWIESSAVTTSPDSLVAVLRGVDHWQAYLGPTTWPAGWVLVVAPAATFATTAVAALGLAGLARRNLRHRLFLSCCLVLGLVVLCVGHRGALTSPFAHPVQTLLDGPLAAFRNIHKFDPVLRLPLALGVGALVGRWRPLAGLRRGRVELSLRTVRSLAVVAGLAVGAVAVGPVFAGGMVQQPRTVVEPSWWSSAADWLAQHGARDRALVVPGTGTPAMLWGSTIDDPMQPVASAPWTARNQLPLAQAGYIRLLDAVEQRLARGADDPTLAALLARSGIRWVVVRNDLDTGSSQATRLSYVHATLATSPGLRQRAHFGPRFGGSGYPGLLTDNGAGGDRPAVQIYEVDGYRGPVEVTPASAAIAATGSADALPGLVRRGLAADRPVLFGDAAAAVPDAPLVADDGVRRREIVFGTPGYLAATTTAGQPFELSRAEHDYLPTGTTALSTMRFVGIAGVAASSSGADVTAPINRSPANGPYAALDDDRTTSWLSASYRGAVGQYLQVDLDAAKDLTGTRLAFTRGLSEYPSRVRVTTDTGSVDSDVAANGTEQPLLVPRGVTRTLRITVLDMATPGRGTAVGIATLRLPGVQAQRTLDVTTPRAPAALAFDVAAGQRATCLPVGHAVACDANAAASGEEDRVLDRSVVLPAARSYRMGATVRLRPSRTLDGMLDRGAVLRATASSRQTADPRVRPGAAVDGDPGTTWTAGTLDATPSLTVRLPGVRTVRSVRMVTSAAAPVSRVRAVRVVVGGEAFRATVGAGGTIRLPRAMRTDRVTIEVTEVARRYGIDAVTRAVHALPVGVGEVSVPGARLPAARPRSTVSTSCGGGIVLDVDGRTIPLRVTAPTADVLAGAAVTATVCGDDEVALDAGRHRLRLTGGQLADPVSLTGVTPALASALPGTGSATATGTAAADTTAAVREWGRTDRTVRVGAGPRSLLVVHENVNAGWQATLDGHRLTATTVDGWQQAFVLPAHAAGTVQLHFAPQRSYLVGLLLGFIGVLALLALAVLRPRLPSPHAAVGEGRLPAGAVLAALAVAGLVLLGGLGVVAAAAAATVATLLRRRRGAWLVGPALLTVAGVAVALFPPTSADSVSDQPVVQLGCWCAVVLAVVSATASWVPRVAPLPSPLTPRLPGARWAPRRKSGRSSPNHDTAATAVADPATRTNSSGA